METYGLTAGQRRRLYESMVLTRRFEEEIIGLARERGRLPGMQILAVGQEAVAAGVVAALAPEDVIVSNHRSHGHLLCRGAAPGPLMAEIMGKATGVNGGKAGTLHLAVPEVNALMTSTVVGAGPPLAAGAAFAQQYRGTRHVTVVFFGDGAAAEGSVHEAMNLAGLWKLPLLLVCENNGWAGAQRPDQHCAVADLSQRAAGYGMPGRVVDGNDVEAVFELACEMVVHCREGKGPALIEARTYRMRGHGEQDHQHYVDRAEIERWAARCPILGYRKKLLAAGVLKAEDVVRVDQDAARQVAEAVAFADRSPYPEASAALTDLWASGTAAC
jgi:pyruvate dehydrogenase E1 component alpha subunit